MTKTIAYGQAVYDLAKSFMDDSSLDPHKANAHELAQDIQATIDDWFGDNARREETPAERRADAAADAYRDRAKEQSL